MKISKVLSHLARPLVPTRKEEGMTIVVGKIIDYKGKADADMTAVLQSKLSESLMIYKLGTGCFPVTEHGLRALLEAPRKS